MEDDASNHEEKEYDELQNQSAQDDVLASLVLIRGIGHRLQRSANQLNQEAENIPSHKDFGKPCDADDGVGLSISDANQSPKEHVHRGSKEDGREQDAEILSDEEGQDGRVILSRGADAEPHNFD